MRVRWTIPALRDLEAIGDYIERDNSAAAARIVTAILDQTEKSRNVSGYGTPRPHSRHPRTRRG